MLSVVKAWRGAADAGLAAATTLDFLAPADFLFAISVSGECIRWLSDARRRRPNLLGFIHIATVFVGQLRLAEDVAADLQFWLIDHLMTGHQSRAKTSEMVEP